MSDNFQLISSAQLRDMMGGVSDMTVYRWRHLEDDPLPSPIRIRNRLYWRRGEVREWIERRADAA